VVSVHGGENFKAESFIPEADIAKIQLGDRADITLDAYGQYTIFGAHVTFIDGAETMIEGVPTYKTILDFDKVDSRIKSGMTANIDIIANERINVLTVPSRAIIDENGVRGVRVLRSDKKTYDFVPVEIGIKGSDGKTEIIDGIEVGDEVVTFLK
jgi:multidrug efflux pump subunit AcrA (membrane-fusion protein)